MKNNRKTKIEKLIVRDQIPVSIDYRVRVKVRKPKELARSDGYGRRRLVGDNLKPLPGIVESEERVEIRQAPVVQFGAVRHIIVPSDQTKTTSETETQAHAEVSVQPRWVKRSESGQSNDGGMEDADEGPNSGSEESKSGILEWVCSLERGASAKLVLAWDVVTPVRDNVRWEDL